MKGASKVDAACRWGLVKECRRGTQDHRMRNPVSLCDTTKNSAGSGLVPSVSVANQIVLLTRGANPPGTTSLFAARQAGLGGLQVRWRLPVRVSLVQSTRNLDMPYSGRPLVRGRRGTGEGGAENWLAWMSTKRVQSVDGSPVPRGASGGHTDRKSIALSLSCTSSSRAAVVQGPGFIVHANSISQGQRSQ